MASFITMPDTDDEDPPPVEDEDDDDDDDDVDDEEGKGDVSSENQNRQEVAEPNDNDKDVDNDNDNESSDVETEVHVANDLGESYLFKSDSPQAEPEHMAPTSPINNVPDPVEGLPRGSPAVDDDKVDNDDVHYPKSAVEIPLLLEEQTSDNILADKDRATETVTQSTTDEIAVETVDTNMPLTSALVAVLEETPKLEPPKEGIITIDDPWSSSMTAADADDNEASSEPESQPPQPPARSSNSTDIPLQETKGAKILLSRFSSWRKKANEAVVQNVQAFSQTELAQQLKTHAEVVKTQAGVVKTRAEVAFRTSVVPEASSDGQKGVSKEGVTASSDKTPQQEPEQNHEGTEEAVHNLNAAAESVNDSGVTEPKLPVASREAGAPFSDDDVGVMSDGGATSSADDDSEYCTTDYTDSLSNDATGLRAAAAALYVRTAASVITDSVSSGFRGRYGDESESVPNNKQEKQQSQTAKILSSRAAEHMQSIIDTLDESHEYVMLLGHGRLGVNLRQTYLKNHGVYVDYLVEGGAAYNSKVVYAGDVVQKVGNVSVAKGTILNVPKVVADSKRPAILVFSTGQKVESYKVNYIDLAIAMMHEIKDEESRRGILRMPLFQNSPGKRDVVDASSFVSSSPVGTGTTNESSPAKTTDINNDGVETSETTYWVIPRHPLDAINPANVPPPPAAAKEALKAHLAKRGNGAFIASMMTNAAATTGMGNFRTILRHAFITCSLDGRRLPFLSRHFATINSTGDGDELKESNDTQKTNASVELMLFLELAAFVELFGATPKSRRCDIAKRIAFKFFLAHKIGNRVEKPMFDFSHLVEEKELTALRDLLLEPDQNEASHILRGTFLPFQEAVMERLHGAPFISFLMSDECARMRGYLRDTAPYRTVSPGDIFFHVVTLEGDSHAFNHLLYNLVYLLCQRERETCGENDDIVGEKCNRVMGAAGGLCCALFIRKTLLKIVDVASVALDKDVLLTSQVFHDLKQAYEQLWDMFITPHGGALELLSNSNETEDELATLRKRLSAAGLEENEKEKLALLTNNEISSSLANLFDNLVYDYSVNAYSRFREHPFHEWMCAEISRVSDDTSGATRIPKLPQGSIVRLLRRAELPQGISSHKPSKTAEATTIDLGQRLDEANSSSNSSDTSPSPNLVSKTSYPNAHHAIIFGTDDGYGMIDRSANPALSQFDIRRYSCQNIALPEEICETPAKLCRVLPNIETYAVFPLPRKSPFSQLENTGRISADGWGVSLIDFMIPGSDAESSQDGGTYGVSLVFQQEEDTFINSNETCQSDVKPLKLLFEEPSKMPEGVLPTESENLDKDASSTENVVAEPLAAAGDVATFSSPIVILPEADLGTSTPAFSRGFRVATDTPSFNNRLAGTSWKERVTKQRRALATRAPVTIGIVLVSSENVIYAMRDTLSKLLSDFCKPSEGDDNENHFVCKSLVELLGNFAYSDVEHESLRSILQPYLQFGSSPWLRQPARVQAEEFAMECGQRLLESLPLVPLALLYVTVLLEQKVVFSSSRRGILLSAVTAVTKLLHPFKWEHLVVPLVPSSLARDLLEYPAPFIIGLASEDEGNLELLNSLPDDVTLVDLDVGRVILAPSIAFGDDPSVSDFGQNRRSKALALRSQVLYLAQGLGVVFGTRLRRQAWCGDSPRISLSQQGSENDAASFGKLQEICRSFLKELVAGTEACCHWIEESQSPDSPLLNTDVERTVLFDEDRFFQIKNLRAMRKYTPLFADSPGVGEFALSLDDFDLVLECFLRCQSMSSYVSTRPKTSMAFF